jgi:hypothetical protein
MQVVSKANVPSTNHGGSVMSTPADRDEEARQAAIRTIVDIIKGEYAARGEALPSQSKLWVMATERHKKLPRPST